MYEQFRQSFIEYPLISTREIKKVFPKFDTKNLINWQKKGYIIKLRNGYYMFAEKELTEERLYSMANRLYSPSYISLESAFQYYNLIPEGVFTFHSISTLKTNTFSNEIGTFKYRSIRKDLYFGYRLIEINRVTFRMASFEKAILDYLYLNPEVKEIEHFTALRWNRNELEKLNETDLNNYLTLFNSPTLQQKIKRLNEYLHA